MTSPLRGRGLLSSAMPDDITRYTLDFLETHDVLSVAACNSHLNGLVETEAMWRNRSMRTWGVCPHDKPHGMLWKDFYIQQHQNLFMPLVSLLESHRHAVVPFYKAQITADAFLHPSDAVLNALQHSRKLKAQFQQKKEVVQSQLHCINRVAIMPLLFVSWMSLLLCEYFFPNFFVYPYFKVLHPTKEGWEVGTYIDLAVAVRAWPLYVYAIFATIASAHFAGEDSVNEVVVWKMIENSFRNIIHECQFRYVMICVLMMLMVVCDWGLEIFCCVMSVFGCLIALRSAYNRVVLGQTSIRWVDIGMQIAFNLAWAYLHYAVDIIFILVDYVCTPIFHALTFGFHRSVVYGSTTNLFSASVLVLLLVEVLVNLEFTRRNEPSKFHWRRITAVTIRSLINSHVYIYVMLHVGAWHVLLLKVIEEIFTHITEVCLIAFRCENTCGCNKVRKYRRAKTV